MRQSLLTVAVRAVAGPASRPVPRCSRLGGTVHTGNLFPSRVSCRAGRCRPVSAHSLVPLSSPIGVRATSTGEGRPARQMTQSRALPQDPPEVTVESPATMVCTRENGDLL